MPNIQQDLSVTAYTEVGDIEIRYGISSASVKGCSGLMYIKDDSLHYQTDNCCCRHCCKYHFKLSDITSIEVEENLVNCPPGPNLLRLVVSPDTTVVVAMADAVGFASALRGMDVGHGRGPWWRC